MSEIIRPDGRPDAAWPAGDHQVRMPDSSMLAGTEKAPAAAVDLLNRAVQGAHDTLDHLADRAAPAVRQLGETISAAEDVLHARHDQLRGARAEWVERMRTTVRSTPLVCVAAALALGAAFARITR